MSVRVVSGETENVTSHQVHANISASQTANLTFQYSQVFNFYAAYWGDILRFKVSKDLGYRNLAVKDDS